jgi:polyisoprenoid-binding protein YceI
MSPQTSASPAGLATGTWLVDPNAGQIGFAVKTMWGLADVKGTFSRFEGALHVTDSGTTGELIVHSDSLDTKSPKRDTHLRSHDFFDSETHPRVTFATTAVSTSDAGTTVSGDLTVGATHTHLDIPVEVEPSGEGAVVVKARLAVPREDVGLAWNKMGMIKGDARLQIELRLLASQ